MIQNTLFFSKNTNFLFNFIRKQLCITNNIILNNDLKMFHSKIEVNFISEFLIMSSSKSDSIDYIYKYLKTFYENNIISDKKRTIIIYNFHYIPQNKYSIVKYWFEHYSNVFNFIFTSEKYIEYISSFILCKHVPESDDEIIIVQDFFINTYKSFFIDIFINKNYNFQNIRKMLYNFLFEFLNTKFIINCIEKIYTDLYPNSIEYINDFKLQCFLDLKNGNKDILYLEKFLFLLIKHDNDRRIKSSG